MQNQIQIGVGAVVFKDDAVLLVKRKNPPNQNQWAIPGGKINFGETLASAVQREIFEETGLHIIVKEPFYAFEVIQPETKNTAGSHYVVIDYLAEYESGELLAADDAEAAAWVTREDFQNLDVNQITSRLLNDKFSFP